MKEKNSNGGIYLGVCNGSYIAANKVMYTTKEEKIVHKGLSLINTNSIGPVYKKFKTGRVISIYDNCGNEYRTWYQDGGTFENFSNTSSVKVHAKYHNMKPAIISKPFGKGHVVLSGIHPEYKSGKTSILPFFERILKSL